MSGCEHNLEATLESLSPEVYQAFAKNIAPDPP
jgi:hypothetical protein